MSLLGNAQWHGLEKLYETVWPRPIPVCERLPSADDGDEVGRVLVHAAGEGWFTAIYRDAGWFAARCFGDYGDDEDNDKGSMHMEIITHWLPLPTSPTP